MLGKYYYFIIILTSKTRTVEVSQTDFDGNQKPQKLVFYRKPHNTPKTPEEPNYTQRVKPDKNMQDEIEKHEDNY